MLKQSHKTICGKVMIDIDNMSILIVDDMKSMRSIIKKTLRNLNLGQTIHFAENGVEGLRCLHTSRVDIAIIDWKMPVMTGSQMLDAIRNDHRLRDLPVIMVTAESEKDIVLDVAEIEVDGYLLKPLTPAVLDEKIRAVVERVNNPDDATRHVRMSRECQDAGNLKLAIRHMEMAVKLKPAASRLIRNVGLLYGKAGKPDIQEECLLKAAFVNPQDAITRHLLSKVYWKEEKWSEAVRYWCEVLSLTNKFNEDAIKIGEALLGYNQNPQAIKLFSTLIDKTEKNLPLKEKILDMCMEAGEVGFSKQLVEKLMKEFPSNHGLVYKAGQICEALGEEDKALECFLLADQRPGNPLAVKLKIARIYFLKNKVIQADGYLNQVLRMDPKNKEALSMRRSI